MIDEVHIGDLTFGVFPRVGARMEYAWDCWPRNSVGDVVDMILQALEVRMIATRRSGESVGGQRE